MYFLEMLACVGAVVAGKLFNCLHKNTNACVTFQKNVLTLTICFIKVTTKIFTGLKFTHDFSNGYKMLNL